MPSHPNHAPLPTDPDRLGEASLWLGTILTLLPQLVRATSNSAAFPFWDLDPLLYSLSSPAITPSGSLLVDALTLLGAAILLSRAHRVGTTLNLSLILLTLIGASAVVIHGWFDTSRPYSLGQMRTGASWLSAMFAALALWHAAQDLRVRRIFLGTLLGLMSLLAIYGIQQVFVTHAQTLADYNTDHTRFLAAHGWSADSSMAKAFVRRLSQPEASGWFGLANVYASFAAAATAAGLALCLKVFLDRRAAHPSTPPPAHLLILLPLFTLLSAFGLYLAHAKGGGLAIAAALASMLLLVFLSRRPPSPVYRRLAILLGLAAILGPLALILIRGLIGERSHELSLLFRSFYAHASARIFLENPVVGVGPDGYQPAFLLAKPPLCPEEVMSPHCIVQDWLADLGVLGFAWLCILFRFAIHAATSPLHASTPPRLLSSLPRSDLRLLLLLPALATILAAFIESPFITIDIALVRILGLAAWCAAAFAIAKVISGSLPSRIALAGAALALISHAQIDVTASFIPSAPLWAMLIALAAAPYASSPAASSVRPDPFRVPQTLAILPPILLSALLFYTNWTRVLPWERHLAAAAATVRPIAEFSERLSAPPRTQHDPHPTDSPNKIIEDLSKTVGHSVQPTQASIESAMHELEGVLSPQAAATLELAHGIFPDDWTPLREASRLHVRLAEESHQADPSKPPGKHFDRAETILQLGPSAPPRPHLPAEWHWLATILEGRADLFSEPDTRARAIEARLRVVALDPYNLDNALKLFRDYQKLHDEPNTRIWAARTLELHDYTRLDRETRGLSPQDLADVQSSAKAP